MRLVLDTNVVVALMRSPAGASANLVGRALDGDFTILLSVALVLGYEAACGHPAQRAVSGLSDQQVALLIGRCAASASP